MSAAGEQDVTVSYYRLTTSYQITVTALAITSIEVNAEAAPKEFAVGGACRRLSQEEVFYLKNL